MDREALLNYIQIGTDDRIYAIAELLRLDCPITDIHAATAIDCFFLSKLRKIIEQERRLRENPRDPCILYEAKRMGFSDRAISELWGIDEVSVYALRKQLGLFPVYKMIDTCASEFKSYVPYFYSTYEEENESIVSEKKKILVLGSGPIRIGQGVEFDYSTVHAVQTIRRAGYEAIIINNNPVTTPVPTSCTLNPSVWKTS